MDADVIVVGAGLAGLVAAAEVADAGKRVIVLEQEPEQNLGGQAWWSFGGLFLVNSPEQRLMGIHDSHELALRTAGTFPERVGAAASFHGGNLANDAEDSPHLLAGTMTAEVYVGHADNDRSAPPEQRERLAEALSAAGVSFQAEVFDGAAHGFTQADTAAYDEGATDRHWEVLLDLFARNL